MSKLDFNIPIWVEFKTTPPERAGHYIIHAPSADPAKPLIAMAWFDPEQKDFNGWTHLPPEWCQAITHWMHKPNPPQA